MPPADSRCTLLLVDDEPNILASLDLLLGGTFRILTANSGEKAKEILQSESVDVILSDQKMPRMTGVQLLEWVRHQNPKIIRLLMTGFAELEEAVDAINRSQVFRYIFKPWQAEELVGILDTVARTVQLERNNVDLLQRLRDVNDQLLGVNEELELRVAERTRQLDARSRDLEDLNRELEKKNRLMETLALTDPLTALPNRRAMDGFVERELSRNQRHPGPLALAIVDVDRFKSINERYHLPGGDQVLKRLARVLAETVRGADFVGRIGGEEFQVVAPETDAEGASTLAERIRTQVEATPFDVSGEVVRITVSLGVVQVGVGIPVEYDRLKQLASEALTHAKTAGRNRCVFAAYA